MKSFMFFAMPAALLTAQLFAAQLLSAQDKSAQAAPAHAAKADSAAPGLPAGATEVQPNLYRYTDAKGKTWMYKRTPFGFSKWEDKPEASQPVQTNNAPLVVDLGDSYRFEEKTPFGVSKWTRKKTELTEDEKAFVRSAQDKQSDKQKSAPVSQHAEEKK